MSETTPSFNGAAAKAPARPFGIAEIPGVLANAKVIELTGGLYAVGIGATTSRWHEVAGLVLPTTQINGSRLGDLSSAEVLAPSGGRPGWVGPEGGTVVVNIPAVGGHILITTYRSAEQDAAPLAIQVSRLDQLAVSASESEGEAATGADLRDVPAEILLHVDALGDCRFATGGWAGELGQKRRVEAFGVIPQDTLSPDDVEYKAYAAKGRETPWVTSGKLCGTRNRGLALTGFAVRLAPRLRDRFDIYYQGSFFESGVSDPVSNGERCASSGGDDPLEAINIRIVERVDA